jgi:hypothetical protein
LLGSGELRLGRMSQRRRGSIAALIGCGRTVVFGRYRPHQQA